MKKPKETMIDVEDSTLECGKNDIGLNKRSNISKEPYYVIFGKSMKMRLESKKDAIVIQKAFSSIGYRVKIRKLSKSELEE